MADKTIAKLEEYVDSKRNSAEMNQDSSEEKRNKREIPQDDGGVTDAMLAQWWLDFGINRKITKRGLCHFAPSAVLTQGLVHFGIVPSCTSGLSHFEPRRVLTHGANARNGLCLGGMISHSDTLRLQGLVSADYLQVELRADPHGVGIH